MTKAEKTIVDEAFMVFAFALENLQKLGYGLRDDYSNLASVAWEEQLAVNSTARGIKNIRKGFELIAQGIEQVNTGAKRHVENFEGAMTPFYKNAKESNLVLFNKRLDQMLNKSRQVTRDYLHMANNIQDFDHDFPRWDNMLKNSYRGKQPKVSQETIDEVARRIK